MIAINRTHDINARSWVESANAPGTDFPIQNLPFCVFRRHGSTDTPRCGVAIGDRIVDLVKAASVFTPLLSDAVHRFANTSLNDLMALPRASLSELRSQIFDVLSIGVDARRAVVEESLVPIAYAELFMPVRISGYTDFFASVHHATNAGRLFRPDQPLLPNYKYVPVGYNGRAASVQLATAPVYRPRGQIKRGDNESPSFASCEKLDYVGSSRVDLQACKLEYSIVSPK